MKLASLLSNWKFTNLRINAHFLTMEMEFNNADRKAAWELYVELLTRISTQFLQPNAGDEKTALTSIFSLFATTREILKKHGPECASFSKVAIIVLNQIIRPFTAKWHKLSLAGAFDDPDQCLKFRAELAKLQQELRKYTYALSDIAQVEDFTDLEHVKEHS
ncbi:MAG: hypothetical protein AAF694_30040 [Bacteroidota bacterium]